MSLLIGSGNPFRLDIEKWNVEFGDPKTQMLCKMDYDIKQNKFRTLFGFEHWFRTETAEVVDLNDNNAM